MANSQSKAGGRTVVEDVNREAVEAQDFREPLDHLGDVVECVGELGSGRHVRLTKSRQIGRHHVKSIRQQRDQISEHMA